MDDRILTLEEVSGYLRVNRATVYRLAQKGKIPAVKIGRIWRFQKFKVNEWLEEHTNKEKNGRK